MAIKRIVIWTLLLTCLGFSGLSLHAATEKMPKAETRKVIQLVAADRAFVLSEMRGMLGAVQNILLAADKGDAAAVAAAAKPFGLMGARVADKKLKGRLPMDFMRMGLGMHQLFDKLAADAKTKKDPRHTTRQVAELLGHCTACHAVFALQEK